MNWSKPFREPIPLPDGSRLKTLEDAGAYITKLPEAEHAAKDWQIAMEALLLVVNENGPPMFARMAIMKALNRHSPPAQVIREKRNRPWLKRPKRT